MMAAVPAFSTELGTRLVELETEIDRAIHEFLTTLRAFDEARGWELQGARSCAEWLSSVIGIGPCAARERLRVARALAELPAISAALASGVLSYSKVRAITRVACPASEDALLASARAMTAAQLERLCGALRRDDAGAGEAPAAGTEPERFFRQRTARDGMVKMTIQLTADEAALVTRALDVSAESPGRRAEALVTLADQALRGTLVDRPPTEVVVHIDAASLEADPGATDQGATLSRATCRRLLCDAQVVPTLGAADDRGQAPGADCRKPGVDRGPAPGVDRRQPGLARGQVRDQLGGDRGEALGADRGQLGVDPGEALRTDRDQLGVDPGQAPGTEGDQLGVDRGAALGADRGQLGVDRRQVRDQLGGDRDQALASERGQLGGDRDQAPGAGGHEAPGAGRRQIVGAGRKVRTIPAALRRAVLRRDGGCRFPGCGRTTVEAHHLEHWADGGETTIDNLISLCRAHHVLVHEGRARIAVADDGALEFFAAERRDPPPAPRRPIRAPKGHEYIDPWLAVAAREGPPYSWRSMLSVTAEAVARARGTNDSGLK